MEFLYINSTHIVTTKVVTTARLPERSLEEGLLHVNRETQMFEEIQYRAHDFSWDDNVITENRPGLSSPSGRHTEVCKACRNDTGKYDGLKRKGKTVPHRTNHI
jgi:hypothetical protein